MKKFIQPFLLFTLIHFYSYSQILNSVTRKADVLYNQFNNQKITTALQDFDAKDREDWTYLPGSSRGYPLKSMEESTIEMVFGLIKEIQSDQGFSKTKGVLELEEILRQIEGRPEGDTYRDNTNYYFSFYGKPSESAPWAFSFQGHHMSMTYSIIDGKISGTPTGFGANPARVKSGPHEGHQLMKQEENLGRELITSFNDQLKTKAIISSDAPDEMTTGFKTRISVKKMEGISYVEMNENQKDLFLKIIGLYVNNLNEESAKAYWKKIENWGYESLYFAWMGELKPGSRHYYKISGPTLLIEYDNTQNNANHVHTVWRDSENDFGRDWLKNHYETSPHHR